MMISAAAVLLFAFPSTALSAPLLAEGIYNIKLSGKIEGSGILMPLINYTFCMGGDKVIFHNGAKDYKCDLVDAARNDMKMTWKIRCVGPENSYTESAEATYTGSSFEATIRLNYDNGAKPAEIQMIKAIYGGPCGE